MNRRILLLIAAAIFAIASLNAQTWNIGSPNPTDVTATLSGTGNNKTLTITGTGAMVEWVTGGAPWYNDRNSIANVTIGENVTNIGNNAFYKCLNLSTVTIPYSVITIGNQAFHSCTGLSTIFNQASQPQELGTYVFTGVQINNVTLIVRANSYSAYLSHPIWGQFNVELAYYYVNFNVVNGNGVLTATIDDVSIKSGDKIKEGKNIVFAAIPNSAYRVKEWIVNGFVQQGNISNIITLQYLDGDITVTVEFELIPIYYTVTFNVVGGNGSLTAMVDITQLSSGNSVLKGKSVVFIAVPNNGYQVKQWKHNGAVEPGNVFNTYILRNLSGNAVVTVEFEVESDLRIVSTTPINYASNVELNATVSATYNRNITANNLSGITINGQPVTALINGTVLTIQHSGFVYNKQYTVILPANCISGYNKEVRWSFSTSYLGIEDTETEKTTNFNIYPNPVRDILNITRTKSEKSRIEIYNSTGTLVQTLEIIGTAQELDVTALTSGFYMLRIIESQNIYTLRFVKE